MNRLVCLGLQENKNAQDQYPGDRERDGSTIRNPGIDTIITQEGLQDLLGIYLLYKHHYRYDTRKDKRHGQYKDHNVKTYSGAVLEGWRR